MDKRYYFFLWIKNECPFCIEAVQTLNESNYLYTVYEMNNDPEALQIIKEKFGWQTVPIVLVQCSNGEREFIGGCDDLKQYLEMIE